ncbi:myelin and lymphocyte protein-like [Tachysurus ichikawai]
MESVGMLPSGMSICSSVPDLLFLPELVFGAAVWILVACTKVVPANPQAYVLAVSLFCFITTFIWMMMFLCGAHHNQISWATAVSSDAPPTHHTSLLHGSFGCSAVSSEDSV